MVVVSTRTTHITWSGNYICKFCNYELWKDSCNKILPQTHVDVKFICWQKNCNPNKTGIGERVPIRFAPKNSAWNCLGDAIQTIRYPNEHSILISVGIQCSKIWGKSAILGRVLNFFSSKNMCLTFYYPLLYQFK